MPTFSHGLNLVVKPLAKHFALADGYAREMDITAIRHRNFVALVDAREATGQRKATIATEFDMSPSYLSQLYGGKKMGDDVARKLEGCLGFPHGWMDHANSHESQAGSASQLERPGDETIGQAIDLLYLMADMRPEDRRFRKLTWPMIQVAAKAITRRGGQGNREIVADLLSELEGKSRAT